MPIKAQTSFMSTRSLVKLFETCKLAPAKRALPNVSWEGLFRFVMFYIYIIQSDFDKSYYKGFSIKPLSRLQQHNNKESRYTSNKTPWQLIYIEIYESKTQALIREKALKKYSLQQMAQLIASNKNQLAKFIEMNTTG